MDVLALLLLVSFSVHFLHWGNSEKLGLGKAEHADIPPRGWNSYDSFCWVVSEDEFLENARLVSQHLLSSGYQYAVVDYLWYRRNVPGAGIDSSGYDVIDEWGRMVPDPARWPSSKDSKGFSQVANKVHAMGLKFGIHVMRGLSTQAYNANTPILDMSTGKAYEESGKFWYAKDIGIKERACGWMPNGFMSVNTTLGAGRAFLKSLYQQYADWNIDFVKHDCVFGADLDKDEITYVSKVLGGMSRPIIYSLSPGTSVTASMAAMVSGLVNMYRITGDDWDNWNDVSSHFDITRNLASAGMIGAKGLRGKSWPDLDMLPLGLLTDPGSNKGPFRKCGLNLDEQRTQMTLWSMAKSPLMFGGDMRNIDESTLSLITNPILLEINAYSSNNKGFPHVSAEYSQSLRHHFKPYASKRYDNVGISKRLVLALSSCKDASAKGWLTRAIDDDSLEQVCWKENSERKLQESFCLYKEKKQPLAIRYEEMPCKDACSNKVQLLATKRKGYCFSTSTSKRLTSKELTRGSFSPCTQGAKQMWELSYNGTLKSSYSGLCASMKTVRVSGGIQSWIATGRKGEIYLAFFNLNSEKTVISAKISDIATTLHGRNLDGASCSGEELWSGKKIEDVNDKVSISVNPHGCSLFTLNCRASGGFRNRAFRSARLHGSLQRACMVATLLMIKS